MTNHIFKKMASTKTVELYFGRPDGTWYTDSFDIPEEDYDVCIRDHVDVCGVIIHDHNLIGPFAFVGVYSVA